MIRSNKWWRDLFAAFAMLGFLIPFLMVMHIIEAGLFLSFLSFAASTVGLFLGLIGAARYVGGRRRGVERELLAQPDRRRPEVAPIHAPENLPPDHGIAASSGRDCCGRFWRHD